MCDVRDDPVPATLDAPEPGAHAREAQTQDVPAFVSEFLLALTNSRIYSADHPRVQASLQSLASSLGRQLEQLGTEALQIGAAGGYLFFDRRPLLAASRSAPRLLQILSAIGSGGLALHRGAGPHEFLALARLLGRKDVASLNVLTANLELEHEHATNVRLLPTYVDGDLVGTPEAQADALETDVPLLEVPARLYHNVFDHLTGVVSSVFRGDLFSLDDTHSHVEQILKELSRSTGTMLTASHYEHTRADQFQFRHAIRVAYLALTLARGLTSDERLLLRIGTAALLHDVGKGRLDWSILHKPGRLTDEERAEMERHTELGARLLLELEDADPLAVAIAFGHHRREGGGGYPATACTPALSLGTHMIKICDVYEALTARRPYKDPMSPTRSFQIMLNMNAESNGTMFDAAMLHRFMLVHGVYPAGSWLELTGGDVARVVRQTGDITSPVVEVCKAPGRLRGEATLLDVDPYEVDLGDPVDGASRSVARWIGYQEPGAA